MRIWAFQSVEMVISCSAEEFDGVNEANSAVGSMTKSELTKVEAEK